MSRRYDWERLRLTGDFVLVPGVRPSQVSHLAKANVRRRLGPRAVVTTVHVEDVDSTFVALAYSPPVTEIPVERPPSARAEVRAKRAAADEKAAKDLEEYQVKQTRSAVTARIEADMADEAEQERLSLLAEDALDLDDEDEMPDEMPPEAE